ncbi:S53 family peptidase [Mycolicibacterium chubuense]|uniref:S53 family peptidase n=1 Tax=Mycolicibacterium chubuense TaxID=1800 RepID=UPI000D6C4F36
MVVSVLVLLTASVGPGPDSQRGGPGEVIGGPYAALLAHSVDLGPSHDRTAQLIVELRDGGPPRTLQSWAGSRSLSVRWRPGQQWAVVEGGAQTVARAFGVDVHDFRERHGRVFYASRHQPAVPDALAGEVSGVGRILGYTPYRTSQPRQLPLDVPEFGLTPAALRTTYEADGLFGDGYTGEGQTIAIFAFGGFDQADLDAFATRYALPRFTPTVIGGSPGPSSAETTMDLSIVHAIAPDAQKVVVNARPTVEGDGAYVKIGQMMEDVDRQFPGAVWSFSISWGCDKLLTATDLAPARSALTAASTRGTTAFMANGDLAGLECKSGDDWSSAPAADNVGLNSVASLPEMVNVGGTTLSTDARGGWLGEQTWYDIPLSLGTSGGVSELFDLPGWQGAAAGNVAADRNTGRRLTPDVAAVADPFTGVSFILDGQPTIGGGTSQAAPIWAGFAAVMNDYLLSTGGRRLGDLNPLLYRIAAGARLPAFRDVTLGGNAVDNAAPGYDLVTGLGTPRVGNLVRDVADLQRETS